MTKKNFKFIPVFQPYIGISDILSVSKSLIKKDISGTSNQITKFEKKLSESFNRDYAITVANGSIALDLALKVLNLNAEDEVIIPSFTIVSVLAAVLRSGAKPVFCDVDKESWNMTLDDVKKVRTSKTKAIVIVHTYGLVADALKITQFCELYNITLIEDAAEAHGQKVNSLVCGSFGLISILSFYANKHLTTGEGGCLLTNDEYIYKQLIKMKNLDFGSSERFKHENLFWNYRMGSLQASLGLSQINKIEKIIKIKMNQGKYYTELLKDYHALVQVPKTETVLAVNHYWVYGIVLKTKSDRNNIIEELYKLGIETRPFFYPLHKQPFLKDKIEKIELPVSERLGDKGLYLPTGKHINESKQRYIINKLISLL